MTYEEMFRRIAREYDLDWRLLAEQAYWESQLDPRAIGEFNEAGLMQILPATWYEWAPKLGVSDPLDPYSNTLVAAAYLAFLRDYCNDRGYAEAHWMLVGYNWGPDNLRQVIDKNGGWDQVPAETRYYVLSILRATETGVISPAALDKMQSRILVRTGASP
jgi:membrane-bound lytic murein transglycosylase MltF